jgi:hypothetical protein
MGCAGLPCNLRNRDALKPHRIEQLHFKRATAYGSTCTPDGRSRVVHIEIQILIPILVEDDLPYLRFCPIPVNERRKIRIFGRERFPSAIRAAILVKIDQVQYFSSELHKNNRREALFFLTFIFRKIKLFQLLSRILLVP